MRKSFLLNLDYEDMLKANQFARMSGFKSFTQFIDFAIKFTIDCMLMPDNASNHAKAALRIYHYNNKNIAN